MNDRGAASAAECRVPESPGQYAVRPEQFGVGDVVVRSTDAGAWGGRGFEYRYGRPTPDQARTSEAGAELHGGVVLAADEADAADDLRQLVQGRTASWEGRPVVTRRFGAETSVVRRQAPWRFSDGTAPDEVLLAFRVCNASAYVAVSAAPELDPVALAVRYAGAVAERLEAAGVPSLAAPPLDVAPADLPKLRVMGTALQDESGRAVRLRGVNLPGLEWSEGRPELAEAVDHATSAWGAGAIRLPLSQDRWFGRAVGQSDGGAAYRRTVDALVAWVNGRGAYVVLTLQWSNGGRWEQDGGLVGQHCMPDEHSRAFWSDVAVRYANRSGVVFGLFNEPYEVAPSVWRDGGRVAERGWRRPDPSGGFELLTTCADRSPEGTGWESLGAWEYDTPGMQGLVDAVRAAGARQLLLVGGLTFAYDLEAALSAGPLADDNVMYDVHLYPGVSSVKDCDAAWLRATERVPVWVGEWGCEYGGASGLIACGDQPDGQACPSPWARTALRALDERGLSWTVWSFNPEAAPALVAPAGAWTDYLPTPVGRCALARCTADLERMFGGQSRACPGAIGAWPSCQSMYTVTGRLAMAITSGVTAQQMGRVLAEAVRDEPRIEGVWVSTWPDGVHLWLISTPVTLDELRSLYLLEDVLWERFPGDAFTMHILNPPNFPKGARRALPHDAEQVVL